MEFCAFLFFMPYERSDGTLGPQKPMWAKFLEFDFFFLSGKTKLQILPGKQSSWAHIIFIHKSYNEIVYKIVK